MTLYNSFSVFNELEKRFMLFPDLNGEILKTKLNYFSLEKKA